MCIPILVAYPSHAWEKPGEHGSSTTVPLISPWFAVKKSSQALPTNRPTAESTGLAIVSFVSSEQQLGGALVLKLVGYWDSDWFDAYCVLNVNLYQKETIYYYKQLSEKNSYLIYLDYVEMKFTYKSFKPEEKLRLEKKYRHCE